MYPEQAEHNGQPGSHEWRPSKKSADENGSVFLGVRRRYSSALVIEFRKSSIGFDSTPAFAVLWFFELTDEEEKTVTLKVWKGGKENLKRASNCCDYEGINEGEQPLGEIELGVKLWRGLSGYHKSYAERQRSSEMRDVMELLDTVNDEQMAFDDDHSTAGYSYSSDSEDDHSIRPSTRDSHESPTDTATRKKLRQRRMQDSDSSLNNSADESNNPLSLPSKIKKRATSLLEGDKSRTSEDGERGLRAQVNDYVQHRGQLHRKHRGAMQWKSARTLDWMAGKVKRSKGVVEDLFRHGEKEQGVETEV